MIISFYIRKIGKFFPGLTADAEFCLLTGDGSRQISVCFNRNIIIRKFTNDIRENFCINCNNSFLQNGTVNDGFNSKFHIIGCKFNIVCGCINQNTFQDRHGCFSWDCFQNNIHTF